MSVLDPQPIPSSVLTSIDYSRASMSIGCEVAAIKAVAYVESPRGPFDEQGRPTILFEPRLFSKLTSGHYDAAYPIVSDPSIPSHYGKFSEQYPRLTLAYGLDADAALKACSWGMFQILALNCERAGFPSPMAMVTALRVSVEAHLTAFTNFIKSDAYLVEALQAKNWPLFAQHYNGAAYKASGYDEKITAAYQKIVAGG